MRTTDYVLRFRGLPDGKKPREKLLKSDPAALSSAELVAVIWNVGGSKEDVLRVACCTVKEYGEGNRQR